MATDSFTGSNGTTPPNSNWSNVLITSDGGNIEIQSNQAASVGAHGNGWYNAAQFGPAVRVTITHSVKHANGDQGGLWLRLIDPGVTNATDGYHADMTAETGTDLARLYRFTNNTPTQLGASENLPEWSAGAKQRWQMIGRVLSYLYDTGSGFVGLTTRLDSTYADAGYTGIDIWGTTGRLDDFEAVTIDISPPAYIGSGVTPSGLGTGTGTTSCAPDYPSGLAEGDELIMELGIKPDTATAPDLSASDWYKVPNGEAAGGGGTTGTDTGPTRKCLYYYDADGDGTGVGATPPSGSITVTPGSSPNNCYAWIHAFRGGGASSVWSIEGANGIDSTTGSPFTAAMGTNPGITEGDAVLVCGNIPTDVSTPAQFSAETFTATGLTSGPVYEIGEPETTQGQDQGGVTCLWPNPTGTASAVATFSATAGGTTTNVRGPIITARLRWAPPTVSYVIPTSASKFRHMLVR